MIVCVCKKINSSQIMDAIDRGLTDVEQLTEQLGLGTGCGSCVEYARDMLVRETQIVRIAQVA